jgi:chromosome segregation ATPase
VQQLETSLVTKEGSLQGLRDSNDILKHELDIVKQTNESLEKEIEGLQEIKVKLEGDKEAESEMKNKLGRELHHVKGRLGQMEKDLREMEVELAKKDEEIHQKDEILNDLQSQSEGLRDHFKSLQDKFKVISEESEASLEEKDKTISQLFQEREDLKTQNDAMKSSQNDLVDKLNSLKEQIAHLQGQLDTAKDTGIQLDDFKRILAEKNSLDKQLASERLLHQQEQIKSKAKIARLETEVKDFNKESKRKEEKLRGELQMAEDEIKCLKLQLENVANEKVSGDREEMTEEIERLNEALEEKNMTIESLENDKAILKEEKANLKERLDEEEDKISEIERASTLVAKQLKEEAERAVKGLEEEKQKLTIETEHLKGRLAGISTAQQCTREHANSLEAALAQKDAQLRQLTGETQSMLADRDKEITELKDVVTNLKDAENSLKIELETTLTDKLLEKQRADETAREASRKEEKIQELLGSLTKGEDGQRLKEKNDMLQMENNDLKAELQTMKQQILIAQMTNDVSKRELAEKTKHGDMLEQKLQMTTGQLEQAQLELQQLQDYLKSQRPTYKEKIQQPLNERGPDEIDGSFKMKGRNDPDEISTLKSQLGNKSKTLKNLQSCLRSLKDDMSHIQLSMDHYSSSLQSSYKTSQQLESKIKDLEISRNSSSEPS